MTTIEDVRRIGILEDAASIVPEGLRPLISSQVYSDDLNAWHVLKGDPEQIGIEVGALLDRYGYQHQTKVVSFGVYKGVGVAVLTRLVLAPSFETDGKRPWRDRQDAENDLYAFGYK